MKFAIAMLSIVAIASIIGTVIKQSEPYNNYLIQFGQFWFHIFESFDLYNIYQASWFLVILLFLVVSTSLCVSRNTPKILKSIVNFQGGLQPESLKKFKNYHEIEVKKSLVAIAKKIEANGFKIKKNTKSDLLIAKKGSLQKLGYIFTHLAIVVISIGGLLDGNMFFKFQQSIGSKVVETRNLKFSEVPLKSQLDKNNFSYRATLLLNETEQNNKALVRIKDGYLVQHLPFDIKLDKFHIEHYSTGQPKSFLSDLTITKDGKKYQETISVNKPFSMDGITIYQSDFQDGGSKINLSLISLFDQFKPISIQSQIFKQNEYKEGKNDYVFEFDDFREFNIFQIEDGSKLKTKNIGPSVVYKFRNNSGQALEYQTYQNPIPQNDKFFFMSGMRQDLQSEFRFLRIPADNDLSMDGYKNFVSNIRIKDNINKSVDELTKRSSSLVNAESKENFKNNTKEIYQIFLESGYSGIAKYIEDNVPKDQQEIIAESYIKIIYFISELLNQDLMNANLIPQDFIQDALNAYSDSFFYGPSPFLMLNDYEKIYASGLQLTKDPGKIWVYLGSLFLVLGIFCMIYVQEIRLWVIEKSKNKFAIAFASNRDHIDFENYCIDLVNKLKK
jgi:cytochrome c biogenesis protein